MRCSGLIQAGNTRTATRPMTPTTTSISMRVAPASGPFPAPGWLPVADIFRLARSAFGVVGPQRVDVDVAVLAGDDVEVLLTPRVDQRRLLLQVGSVPVGRAGRRLDQGLQPFLRRRIAADGELEGIQRGADVLGLHVG